MITAKWQKDIEREREREKRALGTILREWLPSSSI